MSLTPSQLKAVAARGDVLVVAGAGTGKTRTLVERCLDCLTSEEPRVSLDEILMVTFTEAAAAEMRQRIRARLEEERSKQPSDRRWEEQLALFETAHIGTLHSFCLQLVRQHFYDLALDPQLTVLAQEEARLLADETLDALLERHYSGRGTAAASVQQLIQIQGRGWDKPIRALTLKLYHYSQTLPDSSGWLEAQLALFSQEGPQAWLEWLLDGFAEWRDRWLTDLEDKSPENILARDSLAALRPLRGTPSRHEAANALMRLEVISGTYPTGKKTALYNPLERFFEEAAFLRSLTCLPGQGDTQGESQGADPLAEDWSWVRQQMQALLGLAQDFSESFTRAKRELGVVDFHDLEQYALRLLWDAPSNQPTRIALQWRQKLRFVFVDEYQDINAAQDKIIEALGRQGAMANRFLVGDVKQSIYKFRLANPRIFLGYIEAWSKTPGRVIPLLDNFRSREGLIECINSVFARLMVAELGGVAYDQEARLRFGGGDVRQALSKVAIGEPCVELHLRVKSKTEFEDREDDLAETIEELKGVDEAAKEARLVALRLREIKARQFRVWADQDKEFRPVEWREMAILLRSPARKAEVYAKEFSSLGIPLQVARTGFYSSLEISDLLSLLQVLDNPLQDVPVLAVLHSPLVGLTAAELAEIRLVGLKVHFWAALLRWHEAQTKSKGADAAFPDANAPSDDEGRGLHAKVQFFFDRFRRWRRLARQVSLSRCLDAVLSETHYAEWLLTQPRGEQRYANVRRLCGLAEEFDQFQRQGLFRFLRFIEAQQLAETEPKAPGVIEENAVQLMSIHQSKGLEFPVVVVADLGKPFNLSDLNAEIILDEKYGLCPQVKPPHTGRRYPSLPYWLARRRQTHELLGEELRLLYVAMTRARDLLVLSGTVSGSRFEKLWKQPSEINLGTLSAAKCYADWLGLWFARDGGTDLNNEPTGARALLRWSIHDETTLVLANREVVTPPLSEKLVFSDDPLLWSRLQDRLTWQYKFLDATIHPAKTSVTALRRRATEATRDNERAELFLSPPGSGSVRAVVRSMRTAGEKSHGIEYGNVHHAFLQMVALDQTGSPALIEREVERLQHAGILSAEEAFSLDLESLACFWGSDLGTRIRGNSAHVQRELPFTARFSPNELAQATGVAGGALPEDEFVLVQGVVDLAVILPKEIWIVDFKTDRFNEADLAERSRAYAPQLNLYRRALSQIYSRPVTVCSLYFLRARQIATVT